MKRGRHRAEREPIAKAPLAILGVAVFPAMMAVTTWHPRKAEAPAVEIVSTPVALTQWRQASRPKPVVKAVAYVKPQRIPPLLGANGLQARTKQLAAYLRATYPTISEIGGVRPDPIRDHPAGLALDVMVYGNTALGNRIFADMKSQKARFGIRYMLWQQPGHYDHLHICVVG